MFKPMKVVKGYQSWMMMRYSGLLGGFRLFGGTALVELLGGEVDFTVCGFVEDFEVEFTLTFVNVKGFFFLGGGGGRGAEKTYRFKQAFPSDIYACANFADSKTPNLPIQKQDSQNFMVQKEANQSWGLELLKFLPRNGSEDRNNFKLRERIPHQTSNFSKEEIRDSSRNVDLKRCTRRIRTRDPMIISPTL